MTSPRVERNLSKKKRNAAHHNAHNISTFIPNAEHIWMSRYANRTDHTLQTHYQLWFIIACMFCVRTYGAHSIQTNPQAIAHAQVINIDCYLYGTPFVSGARVMRKSEREILYTRHETKDRHLACLRIAVCLNATKYPPSSHLTGSHHHQAHTSARTQFCVMRQQHLDVVSYLTHQLTSP